MKLPHLSLLSFFVGVSSVSAIRHQYKTVSFGGDPPARKLRVSASINERFLQDVVEQSVLNYDGPSGGCLVCPDGGDQTFVCLNPDGSCFNRCDNWTGNPTFNYVPSGPVLAVAATIYGICDGMPSATISLNGVAFDTWNDPLPNACTCGRCTSYTVTSTDPAMLAAIMADPSHEVQVTFQTGSVACIARVEFDFTVGEAGPGGDPHITTWQGEHFEYHGECDLTLAKDDKFADGLGLDIQIRTKLVRFWSYIKNVAIKIGDDILEIEGSVDVDDAEPHYWVNFEYQGELGTFAGFPVTQELPSVYKRKYIIDLDSQYRGMSIAVELYKEFIRVRFFGDQQTFGNTVGLMGDYKTGKTLARDGKTVINDYTEFGDEWQVIPSEPKLFRELSDPQFPQLCIKPEDPRGDRQRRLAESNITIEDAEAACASLSDPLAVKDCVYDILATQDLDMVGAF